MKNMKHLYLFAAHFFITSGFLLAQVSSNGLILHLPMNGNANDQSGNNFNGIVNGPILTEDRFGNVNSAYSFIGTAGTIQINDNPTLRLGNTDYTISMWIYKDDTSGTQQFALISKRSGTSSSGYMLQLTAKHVNHPSAGLVCYVVSGGFDPKSYSGSTIKLSHWQHLVLTFSNTTKTLKTYLDGELSSITTNFPSPNSNSTVNMLIGNDAAGNNYPFNGKMDDLRFYNRILDNSEILTLLEEMNGEIEYPNFVRGVLFDDQNNDCINQNSEVKLSFPIVATPGNHYTISNDSGSYSLGLYNDINYSVSPVIPARFSHFVSNPCPVEYNIILDSASSVDSSGFNFGFDYNPCHQLRVDITNLRRRRCFNSTSNVFYTNEGLAAANNVKVYVRLPEFVYPITVSKSYSWDSITRIMTFDIGTMNGLESGNILIVDSVACVSGITGLTQCTETWITPENSCLIDATTGTNWDKSSVMVEGACLNDSVLFTITNTGDSLDGDMDGPSEYRIYSNNVLVQKTPFTLGGGESITITFVALGATIRLEADQRPGYPGNSHPRATIEGCGEDGMGNFTIGFIDQVPQDDEDLHIEISCMQIIDSYDPNDKQVSPSGFGPSKIVLPGTPLDFTIRFQNTGTDTAYKVIVIDTLSEMLDLTTFEPGASSFPYSLRMTGEGKPILIFTFNGINLTDTMDSEPGSHGFIKFKIAPFENLALGTPIENFADIYFDYNDPVRTNTTMVTINEYQSLITNMVQAKMDDLKIFPNPNTGAFSLYLSEGSSIKIFNYAGMEIHSGYYPAGTQQINLSNYHSGLYLIESITGNKIKTARVIKN